MKFHKIWYSLIALSLLLGIHDEKIAVWTYEDPEPVIVFMYPADNLPDTVCQKLRLGIPLPDFNIPDKLP